MKILISIDDTDNLESRGTGFIARMLAKNLEQNGYGSTLGITRHQLLVDPAIPYTSHNSSLCIHWETRINETNNIISFASHFLRDQSAVGSDPGLLVASEDQLNTKIIKFGNDAKIKVLTKGQARDLADELKVHLSEHGGTGGGIIGALAGAGLAYGGNDGRFVWLKGIREMEGVFSAQEILKNSGIQLIQSISGDIPQPGDRIDVGDWFRPVLVNHKPTLIVENAESAEKTRWKIVSKDYIKANS